MSEHVYATLLVHGAPVHLRFADMEAYADFLIEANNDWQHLREVFGADGQKFLLRPTAVDAVFSAEAPGADLPPRDG